MNLVKDLPLFLQISKRIEDDIIYGRIRPGTKLDEAELCEKYDVSRTPIREALKYFDFDCVVDLKRIGLWSLRYK